MPSSGKRDQIIEELLRKSLMGEELVETQFHLYSARASLLGRVAKPRVLCVNNALLAKSARYFLELLSSDISVSDTSLIDLADGHEAPESAPMDDYGYGSDSDLEDYPETQGPSATLSTTSETNATQFKDDILLDNVSKLDGAYTPISGSEQPTSVDAFFAKEDGLGLVKGSGSVGQETPSGKASTSQTITRLRSLASRHILVKDIAFQTWYALLNHCYTNKFVFSPLRSAVLAKQPRESSTSFLEKPQCSPKSMYRLACKVGLDRLRDESLIHIRKGLTEHNILKELSCSMLSKHPELLEVELDVLYTHIGATPVVSTFAAFAKRIASGEIPHGADIIVGIHARLMRERHHTVSWKPEAFPSPLNMFGQTSGAGGTKPLPAENQSAGSGPVFSHPANSYSTLALSAPFQADASISEHNFYGASNVQPKSEANEATLIAPSSSSVWNMPTGIAVMTPPVANNYSFPPTPANTARSSTFSFNFGP